MPSQDDAPLRDGAGTSVPQASSCRSSQSGPPGLDHGPSPADGSVSDVPGVIDQRSGEGDAGRCGGRPLDVVGGGAGGGQPVPNGGCGSAVPYLVATPAETGSLSGDPEGANAGSRGVLTGEEIRGLALLHGESPEGCYRAASCDLRLGSLVFYCGQNEDASRRGYVEINDGPNKALVLESFEAALVSTEEIVDLWDHPNIVGRFGLKIRHALDGLILQVGPQVQPGYRGRLFGLLINVSGHRKDIRHLDELVTIEFSYTTEEVSTKPPGQRECMTLDVFVDQEDAKTEFLTVDSAIQRLEAMMVVRRGDYERDMQAFREEREREVKAFRDERDREVKAFREERDREIAASRAERQEAAGRRDRGLMESATRGTWQQVRSNWIVVALSVVMIILVVVQIWVLPRVQEKRRGDGQASSADMRREPPSAAQSLSTTTGPGKAGGNPAREGGGTPSGPAPVAGGPAPAMTGTGSQSRTAPDADKGRPKTGGE